MSETQLNPNRVVIHLNALAHNYQHLCQMVRAFQGENLTPHSPSPIGKGGIDSRKSTTVAAVVKADAYGHGLVAVARSLHQAGCRTFCIATTDEAFLLRKELGAKVTILKLIPSLPDEYDTICALKVEQAITSQEDRHSWETWLKQHRRKLRIHLKIDRGMGRLGMLYQEFFGECRYVTSSPHFNLVGIMSHLPASEEVVPYDGAHSETSRPPYHTWGEIERFHQLTGELKQILGISPRCHLANSGATLFYPESHFDMVRPGLALYGADPRRNDGERYGLQPVLSFKSSLVQIRTLNPGATVGYGRTFRVQTPMKVGVLPVGYADGFFRSLQDQAQVLVRGQRCPVIGRVSMNLISVDITRLGPLELGEPATLIGKDGDGAIRIEEFAKWAGTISYEVMTTVGRLNPREWITGRITLPSGK